MGLAEKLRSGAPTVEAPKAWDDLGGAYAAGAEAAEMLAVLKEALDEVRGFEQRTGAKQFAGWITRAHAAVAQAEGRQSKRTVP